MNRAQGSGVGDLLDRDDFSLGFAEIGEPLPGRGKEQLSFGVPSLMACNGSSLQPASSVSMFFSIAQVQLTAAPQFFGPAH